MDIEQIKQRALKDWQRHQAAVKWRLSGQWSIWAPIMAEQQKLEHDEYVKKHNLPF